MERLCLYTLILLLVVKSTNTQSTSHQVSTDAQNTSHQVSTDTQNTSHQESTDTQNTSHQESTNTQNTSHQESTNTQNTSHQVSTNTQNTSHQVSTNTQNTSHQVSTNTQNTSHQVSTDTQNTSHQVSTNTQNTSHQVCMLVPDSTQECFLNFEGKPITDISAKISCLQDLMWNSVPDLTLNEKDLSFLRNLSVSLVGEPGKRPKAATFQDVQDSVQVPKQFLYPASGHRTRKEYRKLEPLERGRFHRALNRLYMDGFIETFAKIHALAAGIHLNGASFLPWHRVYLIMFEEALRLYDQTVSLPYWASIFDDDMDNPVNSILWTSKYFGDGEGILTNGPAAHWVTAQGGLERNFGRASTLFKRGQIQQILSQCHLANISRPTAAERFDIEGYHGGPQVWVGGDMSALATTGYDPVFYMHLAYVDYIWEQFRRRQRVVCGEDPANDYPNVPADNNHHPDAPMTGFDWFSNRDGIKPHWTDSWYKYDSEPKCPNCCPNCPEPVPLYCDQKRYVCVSRSRLLNDAGNVDQKMAFSMTGRSPEQDAVRPRPPRNRGRIYDSPPNDGRTVFTALQDAMTTALK